MLLVAAAKAPSPSNEWFLSDFLGGKKRERKKRILKCNLREKKL